jgi:hypothetical protein
VYVCVCVCVYIVTPGVGSADGHLVPLNIDLYFMIAYRC